MARTMRKEVSEEFVGDLSKKLSQVGWILDWKNPLVTARVDYKCVDEKDDVYEHVFQASASLALLRKEESLSLEFSIVDFYNQARCQKKVRFGEFKSVKNHKGETYERVANCVLTSSHF